MRKKLCHRKDGRSKVICLPCAERPGTLPRRDVFGRQVAFDLSPPFCGLNGDILKPIPECAFIKIKARHLPSSEVCKNDPFGHATSLRGDERHDVSLHRENPISGQSRRQASAHSRARHRRHQVRGTQCPVNKKIHELRETLAEVFGDPGPDDTANQCRDNQVHIGEQDRVFDHLVENINDRFHCAVAVAIAQRI